ncbi:SSI family serine proteinase inhibitor [Lentzea sp. NEAU-D7]|uniref:SSI family serine proteinase inhibitor n=1 Tax=Lentzea sp. NEAU-D7 TaxID=2994667 RepID=UPI00224B8628|nr:SSI family serine proteinase inhibitor [Lentzea sp. NEAU-D7]MCX2950466.1 SSI family serine proteinase inhibitor [Lentzea sp. NEAU-D7]
MARTRILLACLALAAPIVPATAHAAPLTATLLPASGLVLSVQPEMGTLSTTQLNCEPAGGAHKHAEQACDQLMPVEGDFRRLEETGAMCTMELNPTKATLRGKWRNKRIDFQEVFSNPCVLRANTGKVFDF